MSNLKSQKNIIIVSIFIIVVILVLFYANNNKISSTVVIPTKDITVASNLTADILVKVSTEIKDLETKVSTNTCVDAGPATCYEENLQLGIRYEAKGEISNAIKSYLKAAAISPKEYVPYSNIGSAYYGVGKFTDAEKAFIKVTEIAPTNITTYSKLFSLYTHELKKSPSEMNQFFTNALKNTNNDPTLLQLKQSYIPQ